MTPTTLAAAILRDVIRWTMADNVKFLAEHEVLAALTAAMNPALSERAGDVLEGVSDGAWKVVRNRDKTLNVVSGADADGDTHKICLVNGADEANARFIAWCREGVPALLAQNAALRAGVAFTATDGQRLLRKIDVIGVCDNQSLCFEGECDTARCGPCAAKIAARDGVELNGYTYSNAQAMRLQRELTAAEAQIAALTARVEGLTGALRKAEQDFYEAANRFQDEDYEGPHEKFTVNVVCHIKPYFDMNMKHLRDSAAAARAALSATTDAAHVNETPKSEHDAGNVLTDAALIARLREIQGQAGLFASAAADLITDLLAKNAALRAERDELSSKLEVERFVTDAMHRLAKAAEAQIAALTARVERLEAMLYQMIDDPEYWTPYARATLSAPTEERK